MLRMLSTEMTSINRNTIPIHGGPVKPGLHLQSNEPPLFTQTSFSLQGLFARVHSSISNVQKKGL